MKKTIQHLKLVSTQTLSKFKSVTAFLEKDTLHSKKIDSFISEWEGLINDDLRLLKFVRCKNVSSILGFSNSFKNTSPEQALGVAIQHLAELDLAALLIREFSGCEIEKIPSNTLKKTCDFSISDNLYFECKYLSDPSESSISNAVKDAREQLNASFIDPTQSGVIWLFSYPFSYKELHSYVSKLSDDSRALGYKVKIVFQVYRQGLFGKDNPFVI